MPDENGVCRCGGTGADGCTPHVPPSRQSGPDRRTALYRQLLAEAGDPARPAALTQGGPASRLAGQAQHGSRLLTARTPYPLLARGARHDPVLAELLAPDQPPTALPDI